MKNTSIRVDVEAYNKAIEIMDKQKILNELPKTIRQEFEKVFMNNEISQSRHAAAKEFSFLLEGNENKKDKYYQYIDIIDKYIVSNIKREYSLITSYRINKKPEVVIISNVVEAGEPLNRIKEESEKIIKKLDIKHIPVRFVTQEEVLQEKELLRDCEQALVFEHSGQIASYVTELDALMNIDPSETEKILETIFLELKDKISFEEEYSNFLAKKLGDQIERFDQLDDLELTNLLGFDASILNKDNVSIMDLCISLNIDKFIESLPAQKVMLISKKINEFIEDFVNKHGDKIWDIGRKKQIELIDAAMSKVQDENFSPELKKAYSKLQELTKKALLLPKETYEILLDIQNEHEPLLMSDAILLETDIMLYGVDSEIKRVIDISKRIEKIHLLLEKQLGKNTSDLIKETKKQSSELEESAKRILAKQSINLFTKTLSKLLSGKENTLDKFVETGPGKALLGGTLGVALAQNEALAPVGKELRVDSLSSLQELVIKPILSGLTQVEPELQVEEQKISKVMNEKN